ncbi:MAG: hypothetical protein N4A33_05670 [Bacteriovoracaceae bacterium]|jgi:hypothetical protein|nr:hypothetical protein [Bacteriovoracaceae bacterium]
MKKLFVSIAIFLSLVFPVSEARADMDPKMKAFAVMATYGTVGGALLGFASMAFGAKSRAIAQGASLGLYAGIIFGAYVLYSYNQSKNPSYVDEQDPYYNDPYADPYGGRQVAPGGFGAPVPKTQEDSGAGGFFGNRVQQINDKYMTDFGGYKRKSYSPPIYMNLLNISF